MSKIVIVAKLKIKEQFKDEVYAELLVLHKSTHEFDEGCIQYELHKDLEDVNSFTFIETWENAELLEAHMATAHFASFVKTIENKLDALEISKLEKLI
ncbi:putative quinol monooxygenase [Arcobacter sp. s6]|uniref:putative quinol monooxygenase n=1 Tax=Arcobacter sp. s6 TaxID=3230363 RepID=UPI0034A079A1